MNVDDALKIFQELKDIVCSIDIEERSKKQALHAMEEGEIELEHPKQGKEPDKSKVKTAIEKTTTILKSAGASLGSIENFIKKAKSIAPYVGQASAWLSTLL